MCIFIQHRKLYTLYTVPRQIQYKLYFAMAAANTKHTNIANKKKTKKKQKKTKKGKKEKKNTTNCKLKT